MALAVFVVAITLRVVPMMAGGGLTGISYYDDGVYFGGSLAVVNGAMPYRDFLLLHPPGVLLAAAPFAWVGRLTTDATGFGLARLGWMVGGSLSAVVVSRLVRPAGLVAAATAGLLMAVYYPQVRQDRSVLLEGVTSASLAVGMWFVLCAVGAAISRVPGPRWPVRRVAIGLIAGGLALGISPATKIWGVVVVFTVAFWVAARLGSWRAGTLVLGGAVTSAVAICLPFFVPSPDVMWRMVVVDQTNRVALPIGILARFDAIGGLTNAAISGSTVADMLVIGVVAAAIALSWRSARDRWAPVLLLVLIAMMMITPSFFTYYPAALSVPLAAVIGLAAARVWGTVAAAAVRGNRRRPGRSTPAGTPRFVTILGVVLGVIALVCYAAPASRPLGRTFPSQKLSPAVRRVSGCVTADEPITLILLDVLSRNVQRGCRVVVDLGGYSYDLPRPADGPAAFPRPNDPIIQDYVLTYLSSGTATISTRLYYGGSLSSATIAVLDGWKPLVRTGRWVVRRPQPFPN